MRRIPNGLVAAVALSLALPAQVLADAAPAAHYVTLWTSEQVTAIERGPANTIPVFDPADYPAIYPDHHGWDFWPLVTTDNRTAEIDGHLVLMSLAVPNEVHPDDRHFEAAIRYASSSDGGATWQDEGWVFGDRPPLGAWQWSAFGLYDEAERRLHMIYTAVEGHLAGQTRSPQVIAMASADVAVEDGRVRFADWTPHRVLLEPDDALHYGMYLGHDQEDLLMAFRDPYLLTDPASGEVYMVFSARLATRLQTINGAIGLAHAVEGDLTNWRLLPPILAAPYVNGELEIPQLTVKDDRYYLFLASQKRTFNELHAGPNGLYGWTADSIRGPWRPLNGTGLVMANPEEQPLGLYAYKITPEGEVLTFVDFATTEAESLDGKDGEWIAENWGGTLGPVLTFALDGERTGEVRKHRTLAEARAGRAAGDQ
jgi:levansucrase